MSEELNFLNIDLGVKSYTIKPSTYEDGDDAVVVKFNPTDTNFSKKIFETFGEMDKMAEEYKKKIERVHGTPEIFKISDELDENMRGRINSLFGKDICTAVAGDINMYAMAGGMPIWANILLEIFDKMEDSFSKEKKLSDEKIAKYTSKYQNMSKYIR